MKRLFNNEWNEWNESACLESMNAGVHRMKRIWQRHKRCLCRQFCLIRRTLAFIVLFTSFVIFSTFVVNNIAFKWKCRAEWSEFNKDTQYVMIGSFVSFAERLRSWPRIRHSLRLFHSLFKQTKDSALPQGCDSQLTNEKFTVNAGQPRIVRRCGYILVRPLG